MTIVFEYICLRVLHSLEIDVWWLFGPLKTTISSHRTPLSLITHGLSPLITSHGLTDVCISSPHSSSPHRCPLLGGHDWQIVEWKHDSSSYRYWDKPHQSLTLVFNETILAAHKDPPRYPSHLPCCL